VATTSPPLGHGNFEVIPVVHRGPYEYSLPDAPTDWTPQNQETVEPALPPGGGMLPEVAVAQREM
jgi:cytochrome c oxidase subunit 1